MWAEVKANGMIVYETSKIEGSLLTALLKKDESEILRLCALLDGAEPSLVADKRLQEWASEVEQRTGALPPGFRTCKYCGKARTGKSLTAHESICSENPDCPPPVENPPKRRDGKNNQGQGKKKPSQDGLPYYGASVNYNSRAGQADDYIVQNGMVVFLKQNGDTCDGRIARSASDSKDEWKGFGVGRPDNGRFGGINGEDYAD